RARAALVGFAGRCSTDSRGGLPPAPAPATRAGRRGYGRGLDRHPDRRPQSSERTIRQGDVAAMGAGDVARNGQPESGAAFVLIARVVEPQERLEHLFAQLRCNTGAVVVHRDGGPAAVPMTADRTPWR